jgi:hypothetical protein
MSKRCLHTVCGWRSDVYASLRVKGRGSRQQGLEGKRERDERKTGEGLLWRAGSVEGDGAPEKATDLRQSDPERSGQHDAHEALGRGNDEADRAEHRGGRNQLAGTTDADVPPAVRQIVRNRADEERRDHEHGVAVGAKE